MQMIEFITDREIYKRVLLHMVCSAKKYLWLATSDLKDLYIDKKKSMVPFLEVLSDLLKQGVLVRLIHAKEPGPAFRKDFDRYPVLFDKLERLLCPRVHFKTVIADGLFAYSGSANLTGAGMGAKANTTRNFESGFITSDKELIGQISDQYDSVWMGTYCGQCKRSQYCPDRPDMV